MKAQAIKDLHYSRYLNITSNNTRLKDLKVRAVFKIFKYHEKCKSSIFLAFKRLLILMKTASFLL